MNWRESITKAQVNSALEVSNCRIDFGATSIGVVYEVNRGLVAVGRRNIPKTKSNLFHILELLGPVSIAEAALIGEASCQLEWLLEEADWMGVSNRVDAIVADSRIVFGLFAEGLILDNYLDPVIDGFAEGRVILNGRVYKLLASSGSGVLGLGNNAVLVDKDILPVP